jgi:hypothetical protein
MTSSSTPRVHSLAPSRQRLPVELAVLASDAVRDARGGEQVALVRGVDEGARGHRRATERRGGDPPSLVRHPVQRPVDHDGHARRREESPEDRLGHRRLESIGGSLAVVVADRPEEPSREAADEPLAAFDVRLAEAAADHAADVRTIGHEQGRRTLLGCRHGGHHAAGGGSVDDDVTVGWMGCEHALRRGSRGRGLAEPRRVGLGRIVVA